MEIEQITPQIIGKKLWNVVRIVYYMVKKGMSKSKLMLDLHLALQILLKRGKLAGKALTCRSDDSVRFFTGPHEYEFSCSNSPALFYVNKRKRHNRRESKVDADVFRMVFEILNDRSSEAAAADGSSSSPAMALPGFGRTPTVRQLRVTDSPFPLEENINSQVDVDAEEFIKKFYKELNRQKKIAALASPSPYHIRAL